MICFLMTGLARQDLVGGETHLMWFRYHAYDHLMCPTWNEGVNLGALSIIKVKSFANLRHETEHMPDDRESRRSRYCLYAK